MEGAVSIDPRAPCLIGAAQRTYRSPDGEAPEPLDAWAEVCGAAAADTGGRDVLKAVESLEVIYCQSWQYDDPPARLAQELGISPRRTLYSGIGGTMPQQLVQQAATEILSGGCDVVLVCGGEALATKRRLKKQGARPSWRHPPEQRSPFPFEAPFHPAEVAHEVFQAWLTFPLFDVARRHALGIAPEEYRELLGELMAPMTEVAAANPYAWYPVRRTAVELVRATAENRMVAYPYTKYMVAAMDVDMAGALIVSSHGRADELGVPPDRRVYLRGWCYGTDQTYLAEHPDLARSPAMQATSSEAMRLAGVGIDDIAHLDLYSCFASSLTLALDALGLETSDSRGVTVTGGLPFAGGPGSNYMLHSIATMVDVLRKDPGSYGMVSGVGMHMTKHAYAIYSTLPGEVSPPDEAAIQRELDERHPARFVQNTYEGSAEVTSYTVAHGRDGEPEWGLAICELPGGDRCYARIDERDLLSEMEGSEWVGAEVEVVTAPGGVNRIGG